MRNKYQIAVNVIRRYIDYDMVESPSLMRSSVETLQELVNNYCAMYEDMIEDAKFLKEVVEPNWEEIKKSSRYFEVISPITGEAIGVAVKSGSPVKGKEN